MAGRIRTIKPELLEDELVAGLSDAAWRLFVASWVLADDYGNFRAGTKFLASQVWQNTDVDAEAPLLELAKAGRILVYEIGGQRYAHLPNWSKHQRVDNAGKKRVPTPPDNLREVAASFVATHCVYSEVSDNSRGESCGESNSRREELGQPQLLPLDHRPPTTDQETEELDHRGEVSPAEPVGSSPSRQVWDAYLAERRQWAGAGPEPQWTDKRAKLVKARLREHGLEVVMAAAVGIWRSKWHRDEGRTSFDLAMRDAGHVEDFASKVGGPAQLPLGPPVEDEALAAEMARLAAGEKREGARY